jgi:hypothetical protein
MIGVLTALSVTGTIFAAIIFLLTLMELLIPVLFVVALVAGVSLFTPYEAFVEVSVALAIVLAVVIGFLIHPRRDIYYVRTSVRRMDPDRRQTLEHDFLAVRVELVRLWLLFVPTVLSVTVLVFFAASGPSKFSYLNWFFSSPYSYFFSSFCLYPPLLVFALLVLWIDERRVLRNAEACSATSFNIYSSNAAWGGRVGYAFKGEQGEYYGGDCLFFRVYHPAELATIVFHSARRPEFNKILMGFLFHRLTVMGRGVTELDQQTAEAQAALVEVLRPAS